MNDQLNIEKAFLSSDDHELLAKIAESLRNKDELAARDFFKKVFTDRSELTLRREHALHHLSEILLQATTNERKSYGELLVEHYEIGNENSLQARILEAIGLLFGAYPKRDSLYKKFEKCIDIGLASEDSTIRYSAKYARDELKPS